MMNANELADELDYCYGKEYPCPVSKEAATMLRQQQAEIDNLAIVKYLNGVTISKLYAEIEALKNGLSSAYWHDTFVEVKKPNSDLIYRFKLDDVCKHGVDDGACKECYMEAQEK